MLLLNEILWKLFYVSEQRVTGTCDYVNWRGLRACCVVLAVLVSSIPVEQQVQHCNIGSSLPTLATQSTSTTANTQPQDAQHTPDEEGQ